KALSGNGSAPTLQAEERAFRRSSGLAPGSAELLDLFTERVEDYRATVARCPDDDTSIGTAVRSALFAHDVRSVVVPKGLPPWVDHDGEVVDHDGLSAPELDAIDAVVTGCAVAVAETGTIVLDGAELSGRRAITLVPDLHVCVVHAEQVAGNVPEALARLDP